MLLQREGFPEEEEFVLCTVTGIQTHSVFCTLDEYGGRTGMIHISEIAPGRIRNIRDHVTKGKKVVCKVININQEKGYIDLSLRRVSETQKRQKANNIKQEQLAEKIVEQYARTTKQDVKKIYQQLTKTVLAKYPGLFFAFQRVAKEEATLESMGVEKKLATALTEQIQQRIKPEERIIEGDFVLTSYAPDGVELIKKALTDTKLDVRYRGAGTYHVVVKSDDYKKAEKQLKSATEDLLKFTKKNKIQAEWRRWED
ncbi:translation initiation factor IF-2 subunit alpha [Candidatus Woesearchaeota archaeon]|jgi:translation initiation factor 2 subunit 1|nr:translation initiation factor IF-2 subunit alpha [Candidatus Woesearchaeota archaeon]